MSVDRERVRVGAADTLDAFPVGLDSRRFVSQGGELSLSNPAQLQLLLAMVQCGATLRIAVRGSSMTPFIRDGDVLTIAPVEGRSLSVGDVVAFARGGTGRCAIHRVIGRSGPRWIVRGDNCAETDGRVVSDRMVGRVLLVERDGRKVRWGLGREARIIAWLQRVDLLLPTMRVLRQCRRRCVALRRCQGAVRSSWGESAREKRKGA